MSATRRLFGGALSITLPPSFDNVAECAADADVPDNQELFTNAASGAALVVELVEVTPLVGAAALAHYWEDLASENDAALDASGAPPAHTAAAATPSPQFAAAGSCLCCSGVQRIMRAKPAHDVERVLVHLCVLRLAESDILVSLSTPLRGEETAGGGGGALHPSLDIFRTAVATLVVHDMGLFAVG